jgi:hypothetical protein
VCARAEAIEIADVDGITTGRVKFFDISKNARGVGDFHLYLTLKYESMGIKQD